VIHAASSDTRNAITLPMSSGSPTRPRAVFAAMPSMISGNLSNASSLIRVRVGPGAMELTRIPRGLSSLASYRVATTRPAFIAA
jgi:hypothetical protein